MKHKYLILIVAFLQSITVYSAEEPLELEESLQSLIEVFRNHDHSFADEMRFLVPRIIEIARAELHVALGSRNVTEKAEEKFVELHKELASYSAQFLKAVKEMDVKSKHGIKIHRCVDALKEVMRKRTAFLEADEEHSVDLAEDFKDAYQEQLIIISDILFDNINNEFYPKRRLFRIFSTMSHQDPVKTAAFIHGCFQILAQLTIMEANYVELKMNTEQATVAFQRKAENRLNRVLSLAANIIRQLRSPEVMASQIEADQERFHEEWKSLSHCDFAIQAEMYFKAKYPDYNFFIVSYSAVYSSDKHAMITCMPNFQLFRYKNRNSVIFIISRPYGGVNFFRWARNILDKVPSKIRTSHDRALAVVKTIEKKAADKCNFGLIFVVTMRASACYSGPQGYSLETVKSAEVCNTGLCWVKHTYPQRVIVAGRVVYQP